MHLFYTLLVTGLLVLNEVPAEQLTPPNSNQPSPNVAIFSPSPQVGPYADDVPTETSVSISDAGPTPFAESATLPVDPASDASRPKPTAVSQPTATALVASPASDAVLATYREKSVLPITGYAMYYNPNIMQEVLRYRLDLGQVSQCAECVGNVALLRAGDLNRRVWLQWADGVVEGPFLVVDAAAQHHVTLLLNRNWVIDVDNRTAVRRGMAGPVMVTVWGSPPSDQATAPPFAPLYSTLPANSAIPNNAPSPLQSATPNTVIDTVTSGYPMDTPIPRITPLPIATATPNAPATVVRGGFPTETPVPTMTPLPFIFATATPKIAVATELLVTTPTVPYPPIIGATTSPVPTSLPTLPAQATVTVSPPLSVGIPLGFPTDTPVPTITPLPLITPRSSPPPQN